MTGLSDAAQIVGYGALVVAVIVLVAALRRKARFEDREATERVALVAAAIVMAIFAASAVASLWHHL